MMICLTSLFQAKLGLSDGTTQAARTLKHRNRPVSSLLKGLISWAYLACQGCMGPQEAQHLLSKHLQHPVRSFCSRSVNATMRNGTARASLPSPLRNWCHKGRILVPLKRRGVVLTPDRPSQGLRVPFSLISPAVKSSFWIFCARERPECQGITKLKSLADTAPGVQVASMLQVC